MEDQFFGANVLARLTGIEQALTAIAKHLDTLNRNIGSPQGMPTPGSLQQALQTVASRLTDIANKPR